ncbi:unnamed protein product [Caenorhabditis angaria]|uniref:Uncharacterized protein n=1 Tax=Caenorhabditis angaria TaxID=860376 RepID=A0A9P1IVB4_9PELO|nr:unnamed protein product [Caenorhabditis angaria]
MSPPIFISIGIIAAVIQVTLNNLNFYMYFLTSKNRKKNEFQLIAMRTIMDIFLGFSSSLINYFTSGIIPFKFVFVIACIVTSSLLVRSSIASGVSIDRCLAACLPIEYYQYRKNISNRPTHGPLPAIFRTIGRASEAIVMFKLMKKHPNSVTTTRISNHF